MRSVIDRPLRTHVQAPELPTRVVRLSLVFLCLTALVTAVACGSASGGGGTGGHTTAGAGGTATGGATAASGGAPGQTGGATGSGGALGSGGTMASASGGGTTPATGGAVATGGTGTAGTAATGSGGVSTGGIGGTGGGAPGGGGGTAALDPNKRHLLLRDEAQSMVSYVDLGNKAADWHVATPYGRDMQLVGGGRFMIGTDNGYEERTIKDGQPVAGAAVTTFAGTLTAHRLRNGNTILAGVNWQGGTGIVLVEVNAAGAVQRKITYAGFNYVRLIRQTMGGTFLVTADTLVFEGDATGKVLWRADIAGPPAEHVWQALRIPSGDTVVTTGYGASIVILRPDGTLRQTITGPASVIPYQFVGFQIMPNGNFVVANWQGHMGEKMGVQLLEYNPQGMLVWSYRPNTTTESLSLHAVIVLDGLDLTKLHVDDTTGVLVPVP